MAQVLDGSDFWLMDLAGDDVVCFGGAFVDALWLTCPVGGTCTHGHIWTL